jgi:hypothetical protein
VAEEKFESQSETSPYQSNTPWLCVRLTVARMKEVAGNGEDDANAEHCAKDIRRFPVNKRQKDHFAKDAIQAH